MDKEQKQRESRTLKNTEHNPTWSGHNPTLPSQGNKQTRHGDHRTARKGTRGQPSPSPHYRAEGSLSQVPWSRTYGKRLPNPAVAFLLNVRPSWGKKHGMLPKSGKWQRSQPQRVGRKYNQTDKLIEEEQQLSATATIGEDLYKGCKILC